MPLFETTIPINAAEIQKIVAENWNLKLGKNLRAAQNHTFEAFSEDGEKKYSVRVTPDPTQKHLQRITDELSFVQYLANAKLNHICSPIPPVKESPQKIFLVAGNLIIAVFEWAHGTALNFVEFRWMRDKAVVRAHGRFFAQLHKLSKQFGKQFPQTVKRIQKWDEVLDGILAGTKHHPDDLAVIDDPEHYGVIHGDLNNSNLQYVDQKDYVSVYDTDMVQVSFYLYDLAQACITVAMVQDGGIPIVGTPVEGVDLEAFISFLLEGYESEGGKVDRERFLRMIALTKRRYVLQARQALKQGVTGIMAAFYNYVLVNLGNKWLQE